MKPRPKCVVCGKAYGARQCTTVKVVWDTPHKERSEVYKGAGFGWRSTSDNHPPPPPYEGSGIVQSNEFRYLNAGTGRLTMERHIWDGKSFRVPYEPFCTLSCALIYARAAYWVSNGGRR